jgi:hypothetical protein
MSAMATTWWRSSSGPTSADRFGTKALRARFNGWPRPFPEVSHA